MSQMLLEHACFPIIAIICIVTICSGMCVVEFVVTRFFASVLMWISAWVPEMSIHRPYRNWHVPKHVMKE